MRYRRADATGGTYFFTVNLAERKRTLLVDYVDMLRKVMRKVKSAHPFHIDAMVILPDHLHSLWTLPADYCDYPMRWMLIKAGFSRQVPNDERRSASSITKGERGIRQRRYWEHLIRDDWDFERHVDYIRCNPVKHNQVTRMMDWLYSSFPRYVRQGQLPIDWSGNAGFDEAESFGEST
jgi:putative transposase